MKWVLKLKHYPLKKQIHFELFKMAEEKHGFKFREEPYFVEMQKLMKIMLC